MVGILYESNEWSDWKLHSELEAALEEPVKMIDMEAEDALDIARECSVLISRVFASAIFRKHEKSAKSMIKLTEWARANPTSAPTIINPARAHFFEISKYAATSALAKAGFNVPNIQALGAPNEIKSQIAKLNYPCVIKPDCGGRTTFTAVLKSQEDTENFLGSAPSITYIVEDFVAAKDGFITRIEIVDDKIALVVKRSVEKSGLSSYHEGSTYVLYPDCPKNVLDAVTRAAAHLDIQFGSFDVIESTDGKAYMIDVNSVSNVSEDCTELFEMDLMKEHARAIAKKVKAYRERTRR